MIEETGAFRKRAALVTDATVGALYAESVGTSLRDAGYEIVEITGLYWHFVDLVWVFIFAFFYLW